MFNRDFQIKKRRDSVRQFFIAVDNSNFSFRCRNYSRYRFKPGYQGSLHAHTFAEILFVTDGQGFFHIKDQKVPIRRGMIIINNRNVPHTESVHPNAELEYAVLQVENLSFLSSETPNERQTFFIDASKDYDRVFDFIRQIEWERNIREPFWECALQTQFNSFILYALRNSELMALPVQSINAPNPLAGVHLYLRSRFNENITLEKLAILFNMNKYYLAHTFKATYGDTIIHFLNSVRCQAAQTLLQDTDQPVNDIALSVGFNSCSYFTKTYRQFFGETPIQTRNNFRKQHPADSGHTD